MKIIKKIAFAKVKVNVFYALMFLKPSGCTVPFYYCEIINVKTRVLVNIDSKRTDVLKESILGSVIT